MISSLNIYRIAKLILLGMMRDLAAIIMVLSF